MNNSTRNLNYFIIAAIFIVGTIYFLFGSNSVTFSFNDDETVMTMSGSDDYSCDIVLAEIENVTLGEDMDYGTVVNGSEDRSNRCGIWHNDTLGDYNLYVYTNINSYILVRTGTDSYVFNLDSDETTEAFYTSFLELLEDRGVILK